MINRRLSLRSQLCAAQAFLADGLSVERPFNRAFPLYREHKRLKLAGIGPVVRLHRRSMAGAEAPPDAEIAFERIVVTPE